jgi:TetR/AcrR family transcriptional repressor of uid operon
MTPARLASIDRPSQREEQRVRTRERIFAAALEEFRRVGASAAQIPRIAEAAGVVRGTFYFHFPSKEHVLLELADRVQGEIAAALQPLRERGASIDEVVTRLVDSIREVTEDLGGSRLLSDLMAMYVRAPMEEGTPDAPTQLRDELSLQLGEAVARGELRSDIEPEPLAGMMLNSIFGLIAAPRPLLRDRAAELALFKDVFLRGMRR